MAFADYKTQALSDLRSYPYLKSRAETLTHQIDMLNKIGTVSVAVLQPKEKKSRVNKEISYFEELQKELDCITFKILCIESSLNSLSDRDKEIITGFYIARQRNTVNNLARKTYTDRSCLYRRAQKALERYIYACFGVTKDQ